MVTRAVRGKTLAVAMVGAVVLGVSGGAPGATPVRRTAPAQAACAQPYLPLFGEAQQGGPGSEPTQVWPADPAVRPDTEGTDLSYLEAVRAAGVDTDGDGAADQIAVEGTELVITSGAGVIRLGTAGAGISTADTYPVGDLDGDGHDEVYFLAHPAGPGGDITYLLPGTTAPGTYESADAAVRVPDGIRFPVGEQVDGPGSDVLATIGDVTVVGAPTAIVSGASLMVPGPGGTLAAFVPASALFTGQPVTVLDLGAEAPTIVTESPVGDHAEFLLWQQGVTTRFATAGPPAVLDPNASAFLQAVQTVDGTILIGGASNRGGLTQFIWSYDDPCATLEPVTEGTNPIGAPDPADPGEPAPAVPVSGGPHYTG